MKHLNICATGLGLCLSLCLSTAFAQTPDLESELQKTKVEIAQLKKTVQKLEGDISKTDSLRRDEDARSQQSQDRQAKDLERRFQENTTLQNKLHATQAKIETERNGVARRQNSLEEIKAQQKNLSLLVAKYAQTLDSAIAGSLPWELSNRRDRVKGLQKDLESGSASIDEGFSRFNGILKEEIKQGDEIALINKPLTLKNGESINAQILKVGNQYLVYMDDEGKNFGILERKGASYDWREDLSFLERKAVKQAIEVKGAKKPPQLVSLPLSLTLDSAKGEK